MNIILYQTRSKSKMKIIIFGAGGQAKETIDLIEENVKAQIVGIIDKKVLDGRIFGHRVIGTEDELDFLIKKYKATHFTAAIGDIKIRSRLYNFARVKLQPLSIISKYANISKYAKIGEHATIYPGVVINAEVTIGNNALINSAASIAHEVKIGNHVDINPGVNIAGKVIIDDFCFIGIGASIRENLHIAKNTTIGGGAMVTKDTKPNKTYAGVPAKILVQSARIIR